jgi:HK97 family phage prohead protease
MTRTSTMEMRALPTAAADMRSREASGEHDVRSATLANAYVTRDADGTIRAGGTAIVFDSPSVDMGGWYEVIKRGSVRKLLGTKPDIRLLFNHDGLPLGRTVSSTLEVVETTRGVDWEATFPGTHLARDVAELLERGDLSQMSFRFRVARGGATWTEEEDGRERRDVFEIAELPEISIVTFPAYPATTAGLRQDPATTTDHGASAGEQQDNGEGREAPTDAEVQGTPDASRAAEVDADEGAAADAAAANRRLAEARSVLAARRLTSLRP